MARLLAACRRCAAAWLLVGALGCADSSGATPTGTPGLLIDLTPRPDRRELEVEIRVVGPRAAAISTLTIARSWADLAGLDAIDDLRVSDGDGAITTRRIDSKGADAEQRLDRSPRGELTLRYRVRSAASDASQLALRVGADRVTGVGHTFLLLPRLTQRIPARIRWHLEALETPARAGASPRNAPGGSVRSPDPSSGPGRPTAASAMSSFGVGGDVTADATSDELAHAIYAAGSLGVIEGTGGTRLVHLGQTALEPAEVLRWSSGALAAARRRFLGPMGARAPSDDERLAVLLVPQPGLGPAHEGAFLRHAFGLWYDESRGFDAGLKIVIAHELIHRWIGEAVRLHDDGGRDVDWFSEGFTVHYARKILFDERWITAAEFLGDLERTTDGADAARSSRDGYHRGALYAATLDAALRDRGKIARSLDELLLELIGRARAGAEDDGRMPIAALRERVVRELDADAGEEFDRVLLRKEAWPVPPPGAFGPCFDQKTEQTTEYELGFDRSSLAGSPAILRGLVRGSAAERAGLRDGALVLTARLSEAPDKEVRLTVAGSGGSKQIRYKPAAKRKKSRWRLRPCAR